MNSIDITRVRAILTGPIYNPENSERRARVLPRLLAILDAGPGKERFSEQADDFEIAIATARNAMRANCRTEIAPFAHERWLRGENVPAPELAP